MDILERTEQIRKQSPRFAELVKVAATQSRNEAEFERQINNEIERLSKWLGVSLLFYEQYTLIDGRADAVYNRLVIEYEKPGVLRDNLNHKQTAHAVEQVKAYIEGLA